MRFWKIFFFLSDEKNRENEEGIWYRMKESAFSFHRTKTLLKRKLDILHGLKFKSQALYMYIGNQDGGHGITLFFIHPACTVPFLLT